MALWNREWTQMDANGRKWTSNCATDDTDYTDFTGQKRQVVGLASFTPGAERGYRCVDLARAERQVKFTSGENNARRRFDM